MSSRAPARPLRVVASGANEGGGEGVRPTIIVADRELRDLRDEMLAAIVAANADQPELFVRDGRFVAVSVDEIGRPRIVDVTEPRLRNAATDSARYVRMVKRGEDWAEVRVAPPLDGVRAVAALVGEELSGIPRLVGVVESPIVRPDGSVRTEPGYDPATRLYYAAPAGLWVSVPDEPTEADVQAAVAVIDDVLADFPFDGPASRANAWAFLVTACLRPAISGPTPLAVIDASTPGSGKGLLAGVVARLATGRDAITSAWSASEEEVRKSLTSILLAGDPLVVFDNVDAAVRSGYLCSVLTATHAGDRRLGSSETVTVPVRNTWGLTGNNVVLRGDMPRRAYWVRIVPDTDRPELRTDFKHPRLLQYVGEHRGEILSAIFTLARAWFAAGQPAPAVRPLGSYESWTQVVGGVLELAGIEGFLANDAERRAAAEDDTAEWLAFLTELRQVWREKAFTAGELAKHIENDPFRWRDLVPEAIAPHVGRGGAAKRIGEAFAAVAHRPRHAPGRA